MKRSIVFSLCLSLISALAFDAPVATPLWEGLQLEAQGWSPKPTKAPSLDELRKRQNIQNLILASDGTCGYVSGISASPFGLCCSSCTCGFATTPGHYGAFYCCNTATCESRLPTTCIDNNRFSVSSACDSNCVSDQMTLKCTAAPYVYCNLAEFEAVNVQALFCDSVTISHTQSIFTTYVGEVGRTLSTFTGFPSSTSSSLSFTQPMPSSSTPSSSSTSSTPTPSPTTSSVQSQVLPTSPTSSTSPATPTNSSSPAPIGAIVGGSVGGVAVIAIIGVLIFFLLRRQKPKNDAPHAQVGPTHYVPPTTQSMGPTEPDKYSAAAQQASMYSQHPQGDMVQQYPQQEQGGGYYAPQKPQGAYQYQQAQYPGPDNRYSQQSQAYPQQYQPAYDPAQQVGAQYNPRNPTVPGRAELQTVETSPTSTQGGGRQGGRGATGGSYEVPG